VDTEDVGVGSVSDAIPGELGDDGCRVTGLLEGSGAAVCVAVGQMVVVLLLNFRVEHDAVEIGAVPDPPVLSGSNGLVVVDVEFPFLGMTLSLLLLCFPTVPPTAPPTTTAMIAIAAINMMSFPFVVR